MSNIIQFEKNQGFYMVEGRFENTMLSVCIKVGCDKEMEGENGLAHLVEHICLAYRHNIPAASDITNIYKKLGFHFSGYTNYGQTVLNISFPSSIDCLKSSVGLLNNILKASIVNSGTFEKSQSEVLSECYELTEQWRIQSQIVQFITEEQMNVLPVGKVEDIEQLTQSDAVNFIRDFYRVSNMAFIIQTSLPTSVVREAFHSILQNDEHNVYQINKPLTDLTGLGPSTDNHATQTLFLTSSGSLKKVEIHFQKQYKVIDLKTKIVRMLFEIMLANCIDQYLCSSNYKSNNNFVSDKHITDFFYFCVITLFIEEGNEELSRFAEELVLYLKSHIFSNNEFITAKDIVLNYVTNPDVLDMEHIFENLSSNFFYGEPIHITMEHFRQIKKTLENLDINDVGSYKNWALAAPCKIVISTWGGGNKI